VDWIKNLPASERNLLASSDLENTDRCGNCTRTKRISSLSRVKK
jgi:hypothetical protein